MSAQTEVQQLTEQIMAAAAAGDFQPFVAALDDDLEVFDHLPYRFESKARFVDYLQTLSIGAQSLSFVFHQPSYRAITDTVAIVNAYDHLLTAPKDGGFPRLQCGRTTWVYAKRSKDWKIVSAHFSPLPKE